MKYERYCERLIMFWQLRCLSETMHAYFESGNFVYYRRHYPCSCIDSYWKNHSTKEDAMHIPIQETEIRPLCSAFDALHKKVEKVLEDKDSKDFCMRYHGSNKKRTFHYEIRRGNKYEENIINFRCSYQVLAMYRSVRKRCCNYKIRRQLKLFKCIPAKAEHINMLLSSSD